MKLSKLVLWSRRLTRPSMQHKRGTGFTLVEVMVALAVVAVALPALLLTLSQQLDAVRYLDDRAQAQWVAANRLAELRLILTAKGTLQNGTLSGTEELAGREWYWWSEGVETQLPGFFRYEITVADNETGRDDPPSYPRWLSCQGDGQ